MSREWLIADGPADKKEIVAGQTRSFTVLRPDGTPLRVLIDITSAQFAQNQLCTFSGQLHYHRDIIRVSGNYNTRDRTGSCHTTDAS